MTISLDPEELKRIASACQSSSGRLDEEAGTMRSQLTQLEEAIRGIPQLAMADRFQELNQALAQLSQTLEESNSYITSIAARVEKFVIELQSGGQG